MKKELLKNKLSEVEGIISDAEWKETSSRLKRRLFFRFNPGVFNIYYLTGGIALLGAYTYFLLSLNLSNTNSQGTRQADTVYVKDTVYVNDDLHSNKEQKASVISKTKKGPTEITDDRTLLKTTTAKPMDTPDHIGNTLPNPVVTKNDSVATAPKNEVPLKKTKKIKYVTKRDTIYQIDTSFVIIKKKK